MKAQPKRSKLYTERIIGGEQIGDNLKTVHVNTEAHVLRAFRGLGWLNTRQPRKTKDGKKRKSDKTNGSIPAIG